MSQAGNLAFVLEVQLELQRAGLYEGALDGLAGPKTRLAWHEYTQVHTGPELQQQANAPLRWPRHRDAEMDAFYGRRGDPATHQLLTLPYPMRLAWDHSVVVTRTTVNRRCAESLEQVLQELREELGLDFIETAGLNLFGGVYNNRRTRGNAGRWSTHAWAAAIDLDPARNRFRSPWPGQARMPIEAINVFVRHGWVSGALAWGKDAMHFQAAR